MATLCVQQVSTLHVWLDPQLLRVWRPPVAAGLSRAPQPVGPTQRDAGSCRQGL